MLAAMPAAEHPSALSEEPLRLTLESPAVGAGTLPRAARPAENSFNVQPLAEQDIEEAARLHREALSYSLNSKLGLSHLAHLYGAMRGDASSLAATASRDGVLAGVVSATLDPAQLTARLFAGLTLRRWLDIFGRLALNPLVLVDWVEGRKVSRPVTFKGAAVRPCLTAIAVAAHCRRQGAGRALVAAVDNFFRSHHCAAYHLDTRADNTASRAFYQRLGFVEVEQRGRAMLLVKELADGARIA
jgi:GNAT superfamily N-acetyltransferase